jgi:hypothetical protein
MNEKQMTATIAYFKRKKSSDLEKGIAILINGDVQLIVDANGKGVPTVWDFNLHYESGCFNTNS